MPRIAKRRKAILSKVDTTKRYKLADAIKLVKTTANSKFDETIDIVMNLGVDPAQSDQAVRGMVSMPNAPCPGAGHTTVGGNTSAIRSLHPRRVSPAAASTMA